jgi:hypothetical protein
VPLFQYFGWVGSFLLATLLAVNWCLPVTIAPQAGIPLDQKVHIRIHTDQKWPERVVLDTTLSTLAHDAKTDGETDVAGGETAILAKPQPFEARDSAPQGRGFDRRATSRGAEQVPTSIEKGAPLQNRPRR